MSVQYTKVWRNKNDIQREKIRDDPSENCYDIYLKESKRDNRKTFERDLDNEIDEILIERR